MRGSAIIPFVFAFRTALSLPFDVDVGGLDVDFDASDSGGIDVEVNGQPVENMASAGNNVFEWSTIIGGDGSGGMPSMQWGSATSGQAVPTIQAVPTTQTTSSPVEVQYSNSAGQNDNSAVQSTSPSVQGTQPAAATGSPALTSTPLFTPTGASGQAPPGSHYAGEVDVNNGIATLWVNPPAQSHYAGEINVNNGIATLWVAPTGPQQPTSGQSQQPTNTQYSTPAKSSTPYTPPYTPPHTPTSQPPVSTQQSTHQPTTTQQTTTTKPPTSTTQASNPNLNADQQSAYDLHNACRSKNGVSNMSWDPNLAASAQAYASQLASTNTFQHSTGDERPNQGENLYMAGATTEWTWDSSGNKNTAVTKDSNPYAAAAHGWTQGEQEAFNVNYTAVGSKIPCACQNANDMFESFGHYSEFGPSSVSEAFSMLTCL